MNSGAKRWLLVAIALAFVASYFSAQFNRYYLSIAIDVGIGIIMAVSLNLINGHTGQFSLGHAGFMAVGGFTAARLTLSFSSSIPPESPAGVALFVGSMLLGGLTAALTGLAVGLPSLRLRGDYLAIVTLGFGEIIRVIFQTSETFGAATGLTGIPKHTTLFWTWSVAAVTVYVVAGLVNSTYGRGFIAVHDDEIAASAMGISRTRYKVTSFVIGAFFAGEGRDRTRRNLRWLVFRACHELGLSDVEFLALPGESQRAWLGYFRLREDDEERARREQKAEQAAKQSRGRGRGARGRR